MGSYHTAQICMKGHVVNDNVEDCPEDSANHCPDCGSKTTQACSQCSTPIRGQYVSDYPLLPDPYSPPSYCRNCGCAYPWVRAAIAAAQDLADELEGLTPEERDKLKASIDDLVVAGPQTQVAAIRFKKIMKKVGAGGWALMRDVLVNVLGEIAKKAVGF